MQKPALSFAILYKHYVQVPYCILLNDGNQCHLTDYKIKVKYIKKSMPLKSRRKLAIAHSELAEL